MCIKTSAKVLNRDRFTNNIEETVYPLKNYSILYYKM